MLSCLINDQITVTMNATKEFECMWQDADNGVLEVRKRFCEKMAFGLSFKEAILYLLTWGYEES